MLRPFIAICSLAAAVTLGGCYGTVSARYSSGPERYYADDGVYVVASDYPTFYADGAYWLYDDGVWYSSGAWDGRWVVSYDVPVVVSRIHRPHVYARTHLRGHRVHHAAPRYYRDDIHAHRHVVRDRGYRESRRVERRPPVRVRDHREDRGRDRDRRHRRD